jgi:hypothetical protein
MVRILERLRGADDHARRSVRVPDPPDHERLLGDTLGNESIDLPNGKKSAAGSGQGETFWPRQTSPTSKRKGASHVQLRAKSPQEIEEQP